MRCDASTSHPGSLASARDDADTAEAAREETRRYLVLEPIRLESDGDPGNAGTSERLCSSSWLLTGCNSVQLTTP